MSQKYGEGTSQLINTTIQPNEHIVSDRTDKKSSRVTKLFAAISLGQYNSVLYSGESNSHSSVGGGVVTMVLGVVLLSYFALVMRDIFSRIHYNLNQTSEKLLPQVFNHSEFTLLNEPMTCWDVEKCQTITNREIIEIFKSQQYIISTTKQPLDCTRYKVDLQFLEIGNKGDNYTSLSPTQFQLEPQNGQDCVANISTLIKSNIAGIAKFDNENGLFVSDRDLNKQMPSSQTRLRFYISGLQNSDVVFLMHEGDSSFSQVGIQSDRYFSTEVKPQQEYSALLTLNKYVNSDSVFPIQQRDIMHQVQSVVTFNSESSRSWFDMDSGTVIVQYQVRGAVQLFYRYPDTILNGLTTFGGIFAILKISSLLSWYHKRQFEKSLDENYIHWKRFDNQSDAEECNNVLKQRFNFQNFHELLIEVNDLKVRCKQISG